MRFGCLDPILWSTVSRQRIPGIERRGDHARFQRQGNGKKESKGARAMNRNILYLIIGALAVVSAGLVYYLYQDRQKTPGIEINLDKKGVSIERK
jgi:hypothetical protein